MRPRRLVVVTGILVAAALRALALPVHGLVYDDRNGNGRPDPGEPGLPGVEVSDGRAVVTTTDEGRYRIDDADATTVFVIKPRGWRTPVNDVQLPRYYQKPDAGGAADFPLQAQAEPASFRVLVLTDPQPASEKEIGYFRTTIAEPQAREDGVAFAVVLGDVVYDRPELYAPLTRAFAAFRVPVYAVNGNHDLDLGAAGDREATASFERVFGPSTFAFHYGGALFIGVNNVRFLGGPRFIGGLREDQFGFIENLLRHAPADELVVLMMHIPWFYPNATNPQTFHLPDRARLFELFRQRRHVLWLSGHTHYQRHVFHGPADGWNGDLPLHEYNVAAASGSFWGGPPDASGIPVATMADGTPHGYAILTVDGSSFRTDFRAARHPADYQIGLHAPVAVAARTGYVSYYANVFNGHAGWKVESRIDARSWGPMRQTLDWDPAYAILYLRQDELARPLATPRLPDPAVCQHLWRTSFPADLAPGPHRIEVRATDPAGQTFTATQAFSVVEPAAP